jgi:hypothetical protein
VATFGDRLARFVVLGFVIIGFLLLVRSVSGPNSVAREIGVAIDQGKIGRVVVFSCGAMLVEVMPDHPAILFHEREMNGATSEICSRNDYGNLDTNPAAMDENKRIVQGLKQFAKDLRWDFLVWSPIPDDIIGYGVYLYERGSDRVFAIYIPQLPEQNGGAVGRWRYSNGKWNIENLEYTMRSNFYNNARELLTSNGHE